MTAGLFVAPDALIAAADAVNRQWGYTGYSITAVHAGPGRSVVLEVTAGDGSVFYVGATRYGNTSHADDLAAALALVAEQARQESLP